MPITSAAGLLDALRDYGILDPAQLEKVGRALHGRSLDARGVARELLKHGWVTAYQVNQLLQERGGELLLGDYVLTDRLGAGGMGQVFKARHQLMNRTVALKIIRKERLAHPEAVERFHREIRLAAQLDHPHLVRALDAARVGETHFLVMEYVEGTDLHRLVQKSGPLPVGQACTCARQAALGLQYAAERGLVHRDVKPSNLQLTADGKVVKVLDMGLARLQTADEPAKGAGGLTQAHAVMGTPDYIAPEQIIDPRRVDIRADIYSLGHTLYFLLAGRPPFADVRWEEKLVCQRKSEPQPIEKVRPDVPPALGAVLRKMTAKRPEDRYLTPAAVADALAPFCHIAGPVPAPVAAPPASPINQAGQPEGGWTLAANSTLAPPPAPVTPAPAVRPSTQATVLVMSPRPAPPPTPPPPARSRRGLVLAGGGALVGLLILIPLLVWLMRGNAGGNVDSERAEAGGSGKAPAVVAEPVLGDGPAVPVSMTGHGTGTCTSLGFMPDGSQALSQCAGLVYLWNLRKRTQAGDPWNFGAGGWAGSVDVSRDGKHVAAFAHRTLALFNGQTYKQDGPTINFDNPYEGGAAFYGLAFSPDSSQLATAEVVAGGKGRARVFPLRTREPAHKFLSGFPIKSVAFSPDGKFLVTGSGRLDGVGEPNVRLWNLKDDSQESEFKGGEGVVGAVAFSEDGARIFSASSTGREAMIRIWDVKTCKELAKIKAWKSLDPGSAVAFWPGGRALAGHVDGTVTLWDLDVAKADADRLLIKVPLQEGAAKHAVTAVAISPDGHHGLAALADGLLYLFRLPARIRHHVINSVSNRRPGRLLCGLRRCVRGRPPVAPLQEVPT